jgi:hypothetical protein
MDDNSYWIAIAPLPVWIMHGQQDITIPPGFYQKGLISREMKCEQGSLGHLPAALSTPRASTVTKGLSFFWLIPPQPTAE